MRRWHGGDRRGRRRVLRERPRRHCSASGTRITGRSGWPDVRPGAENEHGQRRLTCYTTASCMPVPQNNNRIVRFGVFELDLSAGELRKSGARLRLQGQPLQVLILLLERAGEVVTREELQQKLWASDTFVDFDHSLNTAINKVREALGDSASSPRYVETLARRGYRFIAPIQSESPPAPDVTVSVLSASPVQ